MPVDSTTYTYSFGRGGQMSIEDMDDNFVKFDDSYTYLYEPATGNYRAQFHRWQQFNQANLASLYVCRTWSTSAGAWRDSSRFVYNYNNDLTELLKTTFQISMGGIWTAHVIYENIYGSNGLIERMKSTAFNMYFTYDASDNIATREDSSFNPFTGQWKGVRKLIFTYDASDRVVSFTIQLPMGSGWENSERYEHIYSGNRISETIRYNWSNLSWELAGKHVYSYDANGNKTGDEWRYWDVASSAFKSDSRNQWTYNSYGQPLTYYSETFEPTSGSWVNKENDFFYRYYYQFFIPSGVGDAARGDRGVVLHPQPASDRLYITMKDFSTSTHELRVFDCRGVLVHSQRGSMTTERVDVGGFPSGIYFLNVRAGTEERSIRFVVSH